MRLRDGIWLLRHFAIRLAIWKASTYSLLPGLIKWARGICKCVCWQSSANGTLPEHPCCQCRFLFHFLSIWYRIDAFYLSILYIYTYIGGKRTNGTIQMTVVLHIFVRNLRIHASLVRWLNGMRVRNHLCQTHIIIIQILQRHKALSIFRNLELEWQVEKN